MPPDDGLHGMSDADTSRSWNGQFLEGNKALQEIAAGENNQY